MTSALETYRLALAKSPLSNNTKRSYESRVGGYLAWLDTADVDGDPLSDPSARDWAVRDYRSWLKNQHVAPSTVNAIMCAIDHLYITLGLGPALARRESLPQTAPRALDPQDQTRFPRELERCDSRDRAIGLMCYYAGLRVAEIASFNVGDVSMSARIGSVTIWRGKGDTTRSVPLHPELRRALAAYLAERQSNTDALFANRAGARLSVRSVGAVVAKVGKSVGIDDLTPHVLRHTFATNLVRQGTDLMLTASLLGHKNVVTTMLYTRPSAADRARAVEMLPVEG